MTVPTTTICDSKTGMQPSWWGIGIVVALGLGLRSLQAFEDRALWLDEAMLALNIRRLSFSELCGPLQYDQAAPVGFLWLQKLATFVVPDDEISARIVPWMSGCLALVIFAILMVRIAGTHALLAVTAMAFSPTLVCYSGEGKQYSLDVLCCVLALCVGVRCVESPNRHSTLVAALLGTVVPWMSHSGVFYLPGVLFLAVMFRTQTGWSLTLKCAVCVATSVCLLYVLNIRQVGGNTSLNNFWRADYVPWAAIERGPKEFGAIAAWTLRKWWELIVRTTGLAPAVTPATAAWVAVAGVTLIMTWVIWRTVSAVGHLNSLLVGYTVLPVVTCLVASAFEIYPFGNRLLLFAAPLVFFLLGHFPLTSVWTGMRRYQLDVLLSAVALTWPIVSTCETFAELRSVDNMFAPHCEEDIRPFVARMHDAMENGQGCYVFHAARPAFEYYCGDHHENVFFGNPGDSEHYRTEVQHCLAQQPSWCFLYAHTAPWGTLEPLLAYEFLAAHECEESAPARDDVRFFATNGRQNDTGSRSLNLANAAVSHFKRASIPTDEHRGAGL